MRNHSIPTEEFEETFQILKKISSYHSPKLKISDEKEKSGLENKFFHQIENLVKKGYDIRKFYEIIDEDDPDCLVIFDDDTQTYLSKNIQIINNYYNLKKENGET